MNCSDSQIPRNKSLFNQHDSSLGLHENAASRKGLEIQVWFITKLRTILSKNLYEY